MKIKKIKKSKRNLCKNLYKEAFAYLKESTIQILIITATLIMSIIIGFLNADKLTTIDLILKDLINKTVELNTQELIFFILQNNLQTSLFGFLSGIFLGIFPIINMLINGVVIGYVIERASQIATTPEIIRGFAPHGIFEIPAILISLGLGLKLGGFVFTKNKKEELKRRFFNSINIFLLIILPLLIIAAIIEGILIAYL